MAEQLTYTIDEVQTTDPLPDEEVSTSNIVNTTPQEDNLSPEPIQHGNLTYTIDPPKVNPLGDYAKELPPFVERVAQDWAVRGENIKKGVDRWAKGTTLPGEPELQFAGQIAGGALDLGGEMIISTAYGINNTISFFIPDFIEKPVVEAFYDGWDYLVNTESGETAKEAVSKGFKHYSEWCKENPNACADFESVVNIGLIFAPVKVKANVEPTPFYGTLINSKADDLLLAGAKQKTNRSAKKIQQLLFPDNPTKEMLPNIQQVGWMRRNTLVLNEAEKIMIKQVQQVKGLNLNRSAQWNYIKINDSIKKIGNDLTKRLEGIEVIIHPDTVIQRITKNANKMIKENPLLSTNEIKGQITIAIERTAAKIINSHPPTPAGLLAARKEFDATIKAHYKGAFDSVSVTSKSSSLKVVRDTINKMIAESVPSAEVRKTLFKQHNLYKARKMLETKALKDGAHRFGRLWQNLGRVIDLKMASNRTMAIVAGSSAFAVANTLWLPVGGAVSAYGVAHIIARGVISPKTKIALGWILKATDRAIHTSTRPSMIKALRADRIIIQDLLSLPVETETTTENK